MNETLAVCGLNCAACPTHLRSRNPCAGCKGFNGQKSAHCTTCDIKTCEKHGNQKDAFCFECSDFPCKCLLQLDNKYRTKSDTSPVDNLKYIRDNGQNAFLQKEHLKLLDYDNCITNFSNSLLAYYGADTEGHATLKTADRLLKKKYRNVVVILLDGMGKNIIHKNLKADGFFNTHVATFYKTVFPPTTVAATTAMMSGKNPCENGWLGWDCYYPAINKNVEVFTNCITGSIEQAADYNVAQKYCGYEDIFEKINKCGIKTHLIAPFIDSKLDTIDKVLETAQNLCSQPDRKFIYAYWPQPDGNMHERGCFAPSSRKCLADIEQKVQNFCENVCGTEKSASGKKSRSDTIVFITADHGHIDVQSRFIEDYPQISDSLVRGPSIETRAANFFVKPGMHEKFEREFNAAFGDCFFLMTKAQVIEKQLFGTAPNGVHKDFESMLGDYLAVGIGDVLFNFTKKAFKGMHAGLTEDEMTIPLIVCE